MWDFRYTVTFDFEILPCSKSRVWIWFSEVWDPISRDSHPEASGDFCCLLSWYTPRYSTAPTKKHFYPGKLTWNILMELWKVIFPFKKCVMAVGSQPSIFQGKTLRCRCCHSTSHSTGPVADPLQGLPRKYGSYPPKVKYGSNENGTFNRFLLEIPKLEEPIIFRLYYLLSLGMCNRIWSFFEALKMQWPLQQSTSLLLWLGWGGELVAVVGGVGSGKSALLQVWQRAPLTKWNLDSVAIWCAPFFSP